MLAKVLNSLKSPPDRVSKQIVGRNPDSPRIEGGSEIHPKVASSHMIVINFFNKITWLTASKENKKIKFEYQAPDYLVFKWLLYIAQDVEC